MKTTKKLYSYWWLNEWGVQLTFLFCWLLRVISESRTTDPMCLGLIFTAWYIGKRPIWMQNINRMLTDVVPELILHLRQLDMTLKSNINHNGKVCDEFNWFSDYILIEDTVWLEDDMIMFVIDVIVMCFLEWKFVSDLNIDYAFYYHFNLSWEVGLIVDISMHVFNKYVLFVLHSALWTTL